MAIKQEKPNQPHKAAPFVLLCIHKVLILQINRSSPPSTGDYHVCTGSANRPENKRESILPDIIYT